MRYLSFVLFVLVFQSAGAHAPSVKFRSPRSFDALPASAVAALMKEGCRVPQGTLDGEVIASNVISGSFARRGQSDVAVLCSDKKREYITVFWGGPARCASRIDIGSAMSEEDINEGLEFDRGIETADPDFILDHYEAYGGTKPPNTTHFGINYTFFGKASVVHYCHDGKWLTLTGED